MITSIKNYIITFIDKDCNEQVIDSNCYMNKTLESKPLYVSLENAKKTLTKIKNRLKSDDMLTRLKYWHDNALIAINCKEISEAELLLNKSNINDYLNVLHINKNNTLQIREVSIEINTNLTF